MASEARPAHPPEPASLSKAAAEPTLRLHVVPLNFRLTASRPATLLRLAPSLAVPRSIAFATEPASADRPVIPAWAAAAERQRDSGVRFSKQGDNNALFLVVI